MIVNIPANDFGQLRIFALDIEPPKELWDKAPEGIAGAFGVLLNPDYIDVLKVSDLAPMSLGQYIQQGYDITPDPADSAVFEKLTGWIIIVMSRATDRAETVLDLAPELKHVTTVADPSTFEPVEPIRSASADGIITPKTKTPMSDARMGGMVATAALVLLFAVVGVMIWIAG